MKTSTAQYWRIRRERERASARAINNNLETLRKAVRDKGADKDAVRRKLITDLEVENSELKKRLNIPRGEHVQMDELAQMEREKSVLTDSLVKEQERNTKMVAEIMDLKQRLSDLQGKWDRHVCVALTSDEPGTTPKQLTKALSNLKVSENEARTARHRLKEMEAKLATNEKVVTALQAEVEKMKREKQVQDKTIKDLTTRMKGNVMLLEARRLIWTNIISEVRKHWKYLTLMDDKKIAVRLFKIKLQEGRKEGEEKVTMAKRYIKYLNQLDPEELLTQGITDRFRGVMEVRRVIEKETARAKALICLEQVAQGVGQFNREWDQLVEAGLPSCWDPETAAFSGLTVYEQKLTEIMNQANLPLEKIARLKAETIIVALSKEFSLLCQIKQCFAIRVDYTELTDIQALVETFVTMPPPGESAWQKCNEYANTPVTVSSH